MRYKIKDEQNRFVYYFDSKTGFYLRTGVFDDKGKETKSNPFMGSFPHLIDIGIMGHCLHGKLGLCAKAGIGCYQSGLNVVEDNMSLSDFESIVLQCKGKTNQVALGGRGDPDQHEHFEEILKLCEQHEIVPSYTTSGIGLTEEIVEISKRYCGAVAVSWYRSDYTIKAINTLLKAKVTTNIHYVLSNSTIDEAIARLKKKAFPKGINAIIFLLHKPKGLGQENDVLKVDDPRLFELMGIVDNVKQPYHIGFDSCTVPALLNFTKNIISESMEPCEGARFSCYIGSDLTMTPCSFDVEKEYGVSLRNHTIQEAWNSLEFDRFRKSLRKRCPKCEIRDECMGGCPLMTNIVLCERKSKEMRTNEI